MSGGRASLVLLVYRKYVVGAVDMWSKGIDRKQLQQICSTIDVDRGWKSLKSVGHEELPTSSLRRSSTALRSVGSSAICFSARFSACMTVVWSRPPNSRPMLGND